MAHNYLNGHEIKYTWNYQDKMEFVDELFLMSSPYPALVITVLYLLFVLKFGPDYMRKRDPFKLTNILLVYNAAQVLFSAYLFYLCFELMLTHGLISKTCSLETEEKRRKIANAMYFYFLAKLSEVFDTIFFILRKKDNQATFLHIYHHTIMIGVSYSILKYEPTYPSIFFRGINSLVHVVMYAYYGLAAFPSLSNYLWWKKYITAMQLVQFVSVIVHFMMTYATSECTPSIALSVTILFNSFLFLYLFSKFYIASYKKSSKIKL